MKPRDRNEIFAAILNTASAGDVRLTKIMYNSFLSYSQVVEYLRSMVEMNFIDYDEVTKSYMTTETGFRFMQLHEKMREMLNRYPA